MAKLYQGGFLLIAALLAVLQLSSPSLSWLSPTANSLSFAEPEPPPRRQPPAAEIETGPVSERIALCHKTVFGNIDLERISLWAEYNFQLGFDDIYIWYMPEMANHSGFAELEALPYVTMLPNSAGKLRKYSNGYLRLDRDSPGNQFDCEKWCLRLAAKKHKWVFLADADEFLWFREKMGVHEFAEKYGTQQSNTWLSFGKWMYSLRHQVEGNEKKLYRLSQFPFTTRSYCFGFRKEVKERRGSPYCPHHHGRSKVMVNPSVHDEIKIHGSNEEPDPTRGIIHFHTDVAHVKEWPYLFKDHPVSLRPPRNFTVKGQEDVNIHSLKVSHKRNADGTFDMYYDKDLEPWMEYVSRRRWEAT